MLVIFSIFVSACFPVSKLILPELIIYVFDEKGIPLENVEIQLYTEVSPAKKELEPLTIITNALGRAQFSELKDWQMESLVVHGKQHYSWSVCIKKHNFVSQYIPNIQGGNIKIVLEQINKNKLVTDSEKTKQIMTKMSCGD